MSTNVIKQTLMGEPGSQTIKMVVRSNERGPQGPQGVPGEAATISAGTAYSVPAGQAPAVINTGTSSAAVFDFYIPKGDTGAQGPQGEPGANGLDGAIQYVAGTGIEITPENVIQATGTATVSWGDIQGTLSNQNDLETALNAKQNMLTAGDAITITGNTISANIVPADYFTAGDTVNGEGSSITLDNTIQARFDDVKIKGDTQQDGTPAPNPNYPQDVNVVTGEQTVTIGDGVISQSYPISLGSIELCKIGTYQDYIYKSGDDWYLHKTIKKMIFDGSSDEHWDNLQNTKLFRIRVTDLLGQNDSTVAGPILSNYYIPEAYNNLTSTQSTIDYGVALRATVSNGVAIKNVDVDDPAGFKAWLSNNNTIVYAPFATATDTKITDATLISQLNDLGAGVSYLDKTNLTVTATSTNLPAILGISALRKSLAGMLKSQEELDNATLIIQKNGTTVATFTTNSSTTTTANIAVPTKVSELNNDSGFISSVAWGDVTGKPSFATVATSGSYSDLTGKPTIPVITMTSTDPGEGVDLAANNFIAVYSV